jgi:hypothetical protein
VGVAPEAAADEEPVSAQTLEEEKKQMVQEQK